MDLRKLRNLIKLLKEMDVQSFSEGEVTIDLRKPISQPVSPARQDIGQSLQEVVKKSVTPEEEERARDMAEFAEKYWSA